MLCPSGSNLLGHWLKLCQKCVGQEISLDLCRSKRWSSAMSFGIDLQIFLWPLTAMTSYLGSGLRAVVILPALQILHCKMEAWSNSAQRCRLHLEDLSTPSGQVFPLACC